MFRIEKYYFLRKKRFLLVKLCFSLHFFIDFTPLDPDPHHCLNDLISVIDKHTDGIFALKTLKQKLFVDGLCYLIQVMTFVGLFVCYLVFFLVFLLRSRPIHVSAQ